MDSESENTFPWKKERYVRKSFNIISDLKGDLYINVSSSVEHISDNVFSNQEDAIIYTIYHAYTKLSWYESYD